VHSEDREKTNITSHYGIYRFLQLPFGLGNAPATFQRDIDIILPGIKWKTCLVYLDDVIVFSKSRKDHLAHVAEDLTLLGNAGLSLKSNKCHFFAETVEYLGHVIRSGRLGVAEKNTNALKTAPLPCTQTELRSFWDFVTSTEDLFLSFPPSRLRLMLSWEKVLPRSWVPCPRRLSQRLTF
jgi:Reverse transcriptase (RNA-dependent DNA polymerase)